MPPVLSPEFSLAAACAVWPPSRRRTEVIHTAAAKPLDWARFMRVVKRHGVLGLVRDGLKHAQPDIPAEIAREIDEQAVLMVRNTLAMAAEAVRLQRLFDDAGLPLLFLKGASLAMLAYGNLGLRSAKDIDLLVPPETLEPAIALIKRAGYRRFDPIPAIDEQQLQLLMDFRGDLGFVHEEKGLQVELHWTMFMNPHAMNDASVMAKSRFVSLAGNSAVRTLGEEDLFAYLCVHGALHVWNQLKWLADINALLAAASEGSAERLYRAASERGAARPAGQAILLCQKLLQAPLPACFGAKLRKSPRARWLEATALNTLTLGQGEQDPREVRFGTTRGTLSTIFLGQSWRYVAAELRNRAFNETDMLAVPLPARLRFFYPILRLPLWFWRHACKRFAG